MAKDPPERFADRLVKAAKEAVGEARDVAVAATEKVDDDYTAADVIGWTAELLNKTLKRAIDFTGAALEEQPDMRPQFDAEQVSDVTKRTVDAAKDVIEKAAGSLQEDSYTAGTAFKTMANLGRVAVNGGVELAQTSLGPDPDKGPLILADHMGFVFRRMVSQGTRVAEAVAEKVDDNSFKPDDWVKSMFKLADIAIMGGVELAETVFIGPPQQMNDPFESDPFDATVDIGFDRKLRMSEDAPLMRQGTGRTVNEIARKRIRFLPGEAGGTRGLDLPADVGRFRLSVDPAGLPSGVYKGKVEVTRADAGPDAEPVQTVEVDIAL